MRRLRIQISPSYRSKHEKKRRRKVSTVLEIIPRSGNIKPKSAGAVLQNNTSLSLYRSFLLSFDMKSMQSEASSSVLVTLTFVHKIIIRNRIAHIQRHVPSRSTRLRRSYYGTCQWLAELARLCNLNGGILCTTSEVRVLCLVFKSTPTHWQWICLALAFNESRLT